MIPERKTSILFVCMGNICRSPIAEGVMRKFILDAGLQEHVFVDSAGTHGYHIDKAPDPRAQTVAFRRGYDLSKLRARQLQSSDFASFDLLLGMDFNNLEILQNHCPPEYRFKIGLTMKYATKHRAVIVHDPYYRSTKDFDLVLEYIEDACMGLVNSLAAKNFMPLTQNHLGTMPLSMR